MPWIRILLLASVVIAFLGGVLLWVGEGTRWPAPETKPLQGEAAEATAASGSPVHAPGALARLVREPQNTWSNVAFVLGGAFLIFAMRHRLSRAIGVTLIAVGVGSFLYHASASHVLRHLDVAAMYWLYLMLFVFCGSRLSSALRQTTGSRPVIALLVTLAVAGAMAYYREETVLGVKPLGLQTTTMITAGVVILTLAEITRRRERLGEALQLLGIVTLLGVAAFFQVNDRPGQSFYSPGSTVQAHALWHVLAAVTVVWTVHFLDRSIGSVSRYYRG